MFSFLSLSISLSLYLVSLLLTTEQVPSQVLFGGFYFQMTRGSSSLGSPGMSQGNRCGTAQMAGERCGRCEQRETESGGSPLETEGLSFINFLCYLFMLCQLYMNMFIRLIVLRLEGRVRLRGRPLHAWRIRPPRSLRRSRVWLMIPDPSTCLEPHPKMKSDSWSLDNVEG